MRNKTEAVKNVDLWKRLLEAKKIHHVSWKWVRGHNGHRQNELCDKLATTAADSGNLLDDPGAL
jgi:ribonuclease HI